MKKSSIALAFLLAGSAAFHTACNPPAATDESTAPADSSASETAAPDAAHNHPHPETNAAQNAPAADRQIREAVAVLSPTQGNTAQGTVTFTKIDEGIRVTVELTNVQGEP